MNLRVLTLLLSIIFIGLLALSVWIFQVTQEERFLLRLTDAAGISALLGCLLWVAYTGYAMYWLVPKADAIVSPELSEQLQRRGDFMFYRVHRLCFYAGSSASHWCNGRLHPEFDFRQLPSDLRIPLAVHFHGMWFFLFIMCSGAAAFELAEYWGLAS